MRHRRFDLSLSIIALALGLPAGELPFTLEQPQAPTQQPPQDKAFLGLQTELKNPAAPKGGVVVTYVWPASAAKEMGFQVGDEVRTLNDILITDPDTFSGEVKKENINAKLRFQVRRGGQDLRIEGRIGSREKTMMEYQAQVRKTFMGKPLPALPAAIWWNGAEMKWEERPKAFESLKGKLTVIMSFDDCPVCKASRYDRLSQMQAALKGTAPDAPVAFAGIFFDERAGKSGKDENTKTASALVAKSPPSIPIAIAYYPSRKPTPSDQDTQVLIHNHGTAILNPSGNVEYIQVVGLPEQQFLNAFQSSLLKLTEKPAQAKKTEEGKPSPQ